MRTSVYIKNSRIILENSLFANYNSLILDKKIPSVSGSMTSLLIKSYWTVWFQSIYLRI